MVGSLPIRVGSDLRVIILSMKSSCLFSYLQDLFSFSQEQIRFMPSEHGDSPQRGMQDRTRGIYYMTNG